MPYEHIEVETESTLCIGDVDKEVIVSIKIEIEMGEEGYGEIPDTDTTASIEAIIFRGTDISLLYTYGELEVICNNTMADYDRDHGIK